LFLVSSRCCRVEDVHCGHNLKSVHRKYSIVDYSLTA
jgi:hypothetical protein